MLRVMTFNLRDGRVDDGADSWPHRKEHVASVVNRARPAILSTQEGVTAQLAELHALLEPGYACIGAPRGLPGQDDEYVQIFYDTRAVECLTSGTFWLSMQPHVPASMDWGASYPRIATWGRFRVLASDSELVVVNTHLDHQSEVARVEGAKMLWQQMQQILAPLPDVPLILTGDFNALRGSDVYAYLTSAADGPQFVDAWRIAETALGSISNSYHGFLGPAYDACLHPEWIAPALDKPHEPGANHIDWILVRPAAAMRVARAEMLTEARNGRFPSDHYPLQVDCVLHAATSAAPPDAAASR